MKVLKNSPLKPPCMNIVIAYPYFIPLLLFVAATFAVYGRILGHAFILSWDDYYYVVNNADIQGFTWDNFRAIASSCYLGNYAPVQMLSYMLDFAIWGLKPGGFLLTNLLVHLASGLLVYRLLLEFHKSSYPAVFGSLIFLLHPVQVETVAWVSQRKSLLAMFFFLASWHCYRRYLQKEAGKACYYLLALLFFLLAGFSKSVVFVLPLLLILYDFCFPLESVQRRWLDKIPFFAISLLQVLVTIFSQQPDSAIWWSSSAGGITAYHGGSPLATFFTMLPVMCRYLWLLVWPANLSIIYENPVYTTFSPPVLLAGVCLLLLVVVAFMLVRKNRSAAFWVLFYLVALLPVAQIIPIVTLMNDRYLYFPMIGVAGVVSLTAAKAERSFGRVSWVASFFIITILVLLSFNRAGVWKNDLTLWEDAVKKSPGSAQVWQNLGMSLQAAGRKQEAINALEQSLLIMPRDTVIYSVANVYKEIGDYQSAILRLELLIDSSPDNVMGLTALGDLYRLTREYDKALACILKAQSLQPEALEIGRVLELLHDDQKIRQGTKNDLRKSRLEGK